MKKIIITEHDGGELANQLWNYVSVMSYAFERDVDCDNWSFFEYGSFFQNLWPKNVIIRLFFRHFRHAQRRSLPRARLGRFFYKNLIARPIRKFSGKVIVSTEAEANVFYLPPTKPTFRRLAFLENQNGNAYFAQVSGAVFRNPIGLEKYRNKLIEKFKPSQKTSGKAEQVIAILHSKFSHIVGVHIRQGDFAVFKDGKFLISQERVKEIIQEYCRENNLAAEDVGFLICSDGPIDRKIFSDLNISVSQNDAVTDLFSLSLCDAIVGSDSTFGHFAAWYGNIPHIVMKNESINWSYYREKKDFFWNKYLTVAVI
jgi:hypothetical protein